MPLRRRRVTSCWSVGMALSLAALMVRCTLFVDTTGFVGGDPPVLDAAIAPMDASIVADAGRDAIVAPDGAAIWSANGHAYLVVARDTGVPWQTAKAEADSMGGHLATIGSAEENQFVFDLATARADAWKGDYGGPYLGASQPSGTPQADGGWSWVTGEPWTFASWASYEPSGHGGEDYLQFDTRSRATWNDINSGASNSFVVEFE